METNSPEILRRLYEADVEFILIGGAAAIAYGSTVLTDDVDICAPMRRENAMKIIAALAEFRPKWRMRPDMPTIPHDDSYLGQLNNMYLRTEIGQLDVLGEIPEVCSYEEAARKAVSMTFGDMRIRVVDVDTLIAAKRVAARPHDFRTIPFLEQWKKTHGTGAADDATP